MLEKPLHQFHSEIQHLFQSQDRSIIDSLLNGAFNMIKSIDDLFICFFFDSRLQKIR